LQSSLLPLRLNETAYAVHFDKQYCLVYKFSFLFNKMIFKVSIIVTPVNLFNN